MWNFEMTPVRRGLLLAWCTLSSGLLAAHVPDTTLDAPVTALAFWAGFYPYMAATSFASPKEYWRLLPIGMVVMEGAHFLSAFVPHHYALALGLLAFIALGNVYFQLAKLFNRNRQSFH